MIRVEGGKSGRCAASTFCSTLPVVRVYPGILSLFFLSAGSRVSVVEFL